MPISQAPSGLLADLYELTMAAGYLETHFEARATFELFVRNLPPKRNFLIAAGLQQALDFLEAVRFSSEDIAYLRRHPAFARISADFFDSLAAFRFSGDVWALPEGTVYSMICASANDGADRRSADHGIRAARNDQFPNYHSLRRGTC